MSNAALDPHPFAIEFLVDPFARHKSLRDAAPDLRLNRYNIWGAMACDARGPRNDLFERSTMSARSTAPGRPRRSDMTRVRAPFAQQFVEYKRQ